jgi:hypothetical protein
MFPSRSSSLTRAAFARPASGSHPVSWLLRSYAALGLPCCIGQRSGFPSSSAYPGANAFVSRPSVRPRTPGASEAFGCGASANPTRSVDRQGSPRLLGRPLQTCRGRPSRLGRRLLALFLTVASAAAFRVREPLGFREKDSFRDCIPAAHLFACLRINAAIAGRAARLATDLPGWALVGRDSHPLDDEPNFVKSSHNSLLSDQQCLVASTERV